MDDRISSPNSSHRHGPAEPLGTKETLASALGQISNGPKSPPWHRGVLAERKKRIESGEAKFLSLKEARKRLLG